MRKFNERSVPWILAISLAVPSVLQAQSPREGLLVQVAEVDLEDPRLVLLHVGDTTEYRLGHLPGARFVDYHAIMAPHGDGSGLALELPDPAALEQTLEGLGISDDSRIVVYMGNDWVTPTARVIFTLDWAGLGDRTRLLDGGMPAWQAAGRPVSPEAAATSRGNLSQIRPRTDLIVDRAWVTTNGAGDGIALLDARAKAVYDGVQADQGRNGHIPGAASLPWVELYDGTPARLRSEAEVRALFARAGVQPGDTVVGYCHIGQYATAMLFAARTLGYDVRLYDGSFQDWARDPSTRVVAAGGSQP